MNPSPKILIVGAGAIGGTAGAWLAARHPQTSLLARGSAARDMAEKGITTRGQGEPGAEEHVSPRIITSPREMPGADVVILAVKLYDLEPAAEAVREALGDRPLVVGFQNGVANQAILPRYFSRVIYGVVCYNAWVEAPGVFGYQKKGPVVLGTPDNSLQEEMRSLAEVFNTGFETVITHRLQDAVHSKLVINLANSVTTLLGLNYRPIPDLALFQKILAETIYEGVEVVRAAGYREERLGGMPSWTTLWAAARLPQILTRGTFRRNLRKMVMSSMGQDVLVRRKTATEIDELNGYLLELAARVGHPAPYNQAVYRLSKEHFSRPNFEPLEPASVWAEIQKMKD